MLSLLRTSWLPRSKPVDFIFWNIGQRIGWGSVGDDVRLVQYLLAVINQDWGVTFADVDGEWGPKTATAMGCFERAQNARPFTYGGSFSGLIVADGFVDVMPPYGSFAKTWPVHDAKMLVLQHGYCRKMVPDLDVNDPDQVNAQLLGMPYNGTCPPSLKVALLVAQAWVPYD